MPLSPQPGPSGLQRLPQPGPESLHYEDLSSDSDKSIRDEEVTVVSQEHLECLKIQLRSRLLIKNLTLGKDSQEEKVLKQSGSGNYSTTTAAPKSSYGGGPHPRQPEK